MNGYDATKGTSDENGIIADCPVMLFFKQTDDGLLEVLFDNLVARAKIPSWRAQVFFLKKAVGFSRKSFNRKDLGSSMSILYRSTKITNY